MSGGKFPEQKKGGKITTLGELLAPNNRRLIYERVKEWEREKEEKKNREYIKKDEVV